MAKRKTPLSLENYPWKTEAMVGDKKGCTLFLECGPIPKKQLDDLQREYAIDIQETRKKMHTFIAHLLETTKENISLPDLVCDNKTKEGENKNIFPDAPDLFFLIMVVSIQSENQSQSNFGVLKNIEYFSQILWKKKGMLQKILRT